MGRTAWGLNSVWMTRFRQRKTSCFSVFEPGTERFFKAVGFSFRETSRDCSKKDNGINQGSSPTGKGLGDPSERFNKGRGTVG